MKSFPLIKKEITISDGRVNYNNYILEFEKKAEKAAAQFRKEYEKQCHSIEDVSNYAFNIGNVIIRHYLEECIEYIIGFGVYSISVEKFADEYYWDYFYTYSDSFQKIYDKYMDIVLTEEQKEEYRQMRKQNRGRWQGGGFGLSGAIKGAATAGAMNMASGAVHSMVNLGGKMISNMAASKDKSKLFNDESTINVLINGVRDSVYNMVYALTNYINDARVQEIAIITDSDVDEAKTLMHNLKKNIVPEEKRLELVINVLELDPYRREAYLYLITNYGDPQNEIETLADFFGIPIHKEKEKLIIKIYEEIDFSTEKNTITGKRKILEAIKQLGLQKSEIKELKEVDKKLEKFDLQARTVDEVVFTTREEAVLGKKELESIKEIISKIDENSEKDVMWAKESIQGLHLKTIIQDKYLNQIDNILEKLDIQARTYKEVVYDTREEADLHKREDEIVGQIYKDMNARNLDSIEDTYNKIIQLSLVTDIKDEYLKKIQESKEKLLNERAKVLATFETVLSKISVGNKKELDIFITKIKESNVSADIKEFVIGQIEKKVKIGK